MLLTYCVDAAKLYSNFAIKEFIDQNLLARKDISKIKLKDGSEIVFDGSYRMEFPQVDSVLIKNSDGAQKMIALNSIEEVYENKYDGERTSTFIQVIVGVVVIGALFIAALVWINDLSKHHR
jgi:hypothetical protein